MADGSKTPLFDQGQRDLVLPTAEKLQRDAGVLADRIFMQWDGEVDVLIVFKARDASECHYAGTFQSKEAYKHVLDAVWRKISSGIGNLVQKGLIKRRPL